jgi:hypothetical protein
VSVSSLSLLKAWVFVLQNLDGFLPPDLEEACHRTTRALGGNFTKQQLSTDVKQMESRIQAARTAIDTRLHDLHMDHGGSPEERHALDDALAGPKVVERDQTDASLMIVLASLKSLTKSGGCFTSHRTQQFMKLNQLACLQWHPHLLQTNRKHC